MKHIHFLLVLLGLVQAAYSQSTVPTPILYLEFVVHNEANDLPKYNTSSITYKKYRDTIKILIDSIRVKKAKLNFQSDYTFLDGVYKYDSLFKSTTNYKNILQWMQQDNDNRIELDGHTHQDTINYADTYYYHRRAGVTPSRNVGGFVYDTTLYPRIPGSNWFDMQVPIVGHQLGRDSLPVQFDVLWGGNSGKSGSGGHGAEADYFGIFHPDTITNFFQNYPSRHLVGLGNGCQNVLTDTTHVEFALSKINTLLNKLASGEFNKKGFYYTRIMMNVSELSMDNITKAAQLIDALNPYVAANRIQWKTITETKNAWVIQYKSKAFEWACDSVAKRPGRSLSRISDQEETHTMSWNTASTSTLQLFPNPTYSSLQIQLPADEEVKSIQIYNTTGIKLYEQSCKGLTALSIPLADWSNGLYFAQFITKANVKTISFVKQ
jgi:hypothetical protein